jgi:L-ascorbate metabolism protein UlaG (beta-lactamase superfamily)
MKITWIGHATVVIDTAGGRLVTDPVLRQRIAHLRRHSTAAAAPDQVDGVLLSHFHHDHVDIPSLRALAAPVAGPPGTRRLLRRLPIDVTEMKLGQDIAMGGAQVTVVRAVHDGRRSPLSARSDDDAVGFVVAADGQRLYFAGDTELFDGMRKLGDLDVALVPIWGWGPKLGPGHMNPSDAAAALALLQPAVAVPIHWGTFLPIGGYRRHRALLTAPVEEFRARAAERAPGVRVEVIAPGGSLAIPARRRHG